MITTPLLAWGRGIHPWRRRWGSALVVPIFGAWGWSSPIIVALAYGIIEKTLGNEHNYGVMKKKKKRFMHTYLVALGEERRNADP